MKRLILAGLCIFSLVALTSVAYSQEVQVGSFSLSQSDEGYSLHKGSGERVASIEVTFPKSFNAKPEVVLCLSGIDGEKQTNLRIVLKASSVSRDGFTIQAKTWADSKVYSVNGSWIAVAPEK